ncbi:hypothetical protein CPB86DRAFT_307669 [Serendipita vermifera]|nr:hypothetical protein CPB86DRAFT_307669 [Serendipita vermifera]
MERSTAYQIPSNIPLSYQPTPTSSTYPTTPPTGGTFVNGGTSGYQPLTYEQTPRSSAFLPVTPHKPEDSSYFTKQQKQGEDIIIAEQGGGATGLFRQRTERIKAAGRRGWAAFLASLGRKWDRAVNARAAWPRVIYCIVGLLICGVWFGVTAGFAQSERAYQTTNTGREMAVIRGTQAQGASSVYWSLEGRLKKFDPQDRILNINWALKSIYDGQSVILGERLNETMNIGIFRDQDLVPVNSTYDIIFPSTVNEIYDVRVANASAIPYAIVGMTQWDSFSTEIDMGQRKMAEPVRQPQFGFPFDLWSGEISFVANFYDRSKAINMTTAFGVEIDDASLVDSLLNWRVTVDVENTCVSSVNGTLTWIATGACGLHLTLKARRTALVKFASIVAVIVNWFSTVFIFVMTCEGVVMRRFEVIMGPQLLAVCFTALFALPSVRSILPGAPEFGALIDLIGIVPNVIIISLCTTLVAIATLKQLVETGNQADAEEQRKKV